MRSGPKEYIIVQSVYDDQKNSHYVSLPPKDLLRKAWICLVKHSFPLNTAYFHPADLDLYLAKGEHSFLNDKLKQLDSSLMVIPLPRTLYELFYLGLYLIDRSETPFGFLDPTDLNSDFKHIETLYIDHKVSAKRISAADFRSKIESQLENQHLLDLVCDLNHCLFSALIQLKTQQLDSILSIDLSITSTTISTEKDIVERNSSEWLRLLRCVLNELQQIQINSNSEISKKYIKWPLFHPKISEIIEKDKLHKRVDWEKMLDQLRMDISKLLQSLVDSTEALLHLRQIQNKCTEISIYMILCQHLCPEILEMVDIPTHPIEMKQLRNVLDFVYYVDPAVSSFQQSGYLDPTSIIEQIMIAEMHEDQEDFTMLFRGTNSIFEDDFKRNSQNSDEYKKKMDDHQTNERFGVSESCLPHSLSFGASMFSGILHDATATAWNYWKTTTTAYYIKVSMNHKLLLQLVADNQDRISAKKTTWQEWFYFPPVPSLLQLSGLGELFHPRSKVYIEAEFRNSRSNFVGGILGCSYYSLPDFLVDLHGKAPPFSSIPKVILDMKKKNQ